MWASVLQFCREFFLDLLWKENWPFIYTMPFLVPSRKEWTRDVCCRFQYWTQYTIRIECHPKSETTQFCFQSFSMLFIKFWGNIFSRYYNLMIFLKKKINFFNSPIVKLLQVWYLVLLSCIVYEHVYFIFEQLSYLKNSYNGHFFDKIWVQKSDAIRFEPSIYWKIIQSNYFMHSSFLRLELGYMWTCICMFFYMCVFVAQHEYFMFYTIWCTEDPLYV